MWTRDINRISPTTTGSITGTTAIIVTRTNYTGIAGTGISITTLRPESLRSGSIITTEPDANSLGGSAADHALDPR